MPKTARLACLAFATLLASGAAHAEEGDYTSLQTLWNLAFPPGPDNPVRASEALGQYGLKQNPAGYSDGFQPGSYYKWQTVKLAPSTGAVCGNGSHFIDSVLDGQGSVLDASESSDAADRAKPFNPLYFLVDLLITG